MAGRRRLPWAWFTVGAVVLSIVTIPVVRGWIGRLSLSAIQPVVRLGQLMSDQLPTFGREEKSVDERNNLRQQVEDLTTKLYETNLQLETVQAVIKLSDFQTSTKNTLIVASVIASSPDPGVQSIVINRGSTDHVDVGQVVVAERGSVVGKVVAVHQNQSTVLLITDRQSVIAARIQNQPQSPGVVQGERGLALQMRFIPKNDALKTSQTVVTSGTESPIPPDILIGSIASTSSLPGDLFQQAIITPSAPLERLRVVAVIRQ